MPSQRQQDELYPRESPFLCLSPAPKVAPWHFEIPTTSYSMSVLPKTKHEMDWEKGVRGQNNKLRVGGICSCTSS